MHDKSVEGGWQTETSTGALVGPVFSSVNDLSLWQKVNDNALKMYEWLCERSAQAARMAKNGSLDPQTRSEFRTELGVLVEAKLKLGGLLKGQTEG